MGRTQDFTNSIIYHIRHMESKEVIYVGSTTNFSQRKTKHKYECNHEERKHFTNHIYCHIRDNGGFDCFEVIPIQSLKLENKTQLLIAEQEEIDKHQTLVNSYKAHRPIDIEERPKTILDDKELEQYNKEYREERKQDLKQYQKHYREENKDYQKQLREENREYYRNYREANKEYHKEYNQKYYQANKAEIIEKYKQKTECKYCAKLKTKWNMSRHIKTCKSKPVENDQNSTRDA